MFTVQMDEEEYRIVGPDGEEGDAVAYGELATLVIDEAIYYCSIEDPNSETPVVYRVDNVSRMQTETEEVTFEDAAEVETSGGGPVLVEEEEEEESA
jgi:hypothetical protein